MMGGNVSSLAVAPESHSILCGDERGGLHSIASPSSAEGSAAAGASSSNNKRIVKSYNLTSPMDVTSPTSPTEGSASVSNLPGHFGMVTSVATHRHATSGVGGSSSSSSRAMRRGFLRSVHGMALTTGVDWSTKLWAPAFREDAPLLSFTSSSYDYMCDVQWCPTNPSVFATASTNGTIDLWNLASSIEDPLSGSDGLNVHKIMGGGKSSATTTSSLDSTKISGGAVNKLEWSLDGKRLAVAAGDQLHVMGLSENVYRPKGDEDARVMNHLTARGLLHVDD
jgi:WD40 repeat protein